MKRSAIATAVAAAIALVGVTGHAALDDVGAATVDTAAHRGATVRFDGGTPERAVLISDSAISGIRWYGRTHFLTGTDWEIYLESCRRLVYSSCRGREGYAPRTVESQLWSIHAQHGPADPSDLLVIAVGYNDWESRFRDDFRTIASTAWQVGFRRVVWLTYRELNQYSVPGGMGRSDYPLMNDILRDELASGDWPFVIAWDYDAAFRNQPQWFYSDGVHVTPAGAEAVAIWLSAQLDTPIP